MLKKFFLLALVATILSGCASTGNLTIFGFPVVGYSNWEDPEVVAAKAAKISAEAGAIRQKANGYLAVADGVAQSVTPENAHLIPISPDDPRHIIVGRTDGGNLSISNTTTVRGGGRGSGLTTKQLRESFWGK